MSEQKPEYIAITARNPRYSSRAIALVGYLSLATGGSAALVVDWLAYSPGSDRTHFALLNDQGVAFAQAEISLVSGVLAPLSPSAGLLQAPYWVTLPEFLDSATSTASVATTKVQAAPQAGSVRYELTISGQDLSGMYFSVGQLFGSGTLGTREIDLLASTAAGTSVPISLLSANAWDDGIRPFTQPLVWDANLQVLSLGANANGESSFAFFGVGNSGTPVTRLVFQVPSGYNSGLGDVVEFGFAMPAVPEAGTVFFGLGILTVCLSSRFRVRRCSVEGSSPGAS